MLRAAQGRTIVCLSLMLEILELRSARDWLFTRLANLLFRPVKVPSLEAARDERVVGREPYGDCMDSIACVVCKTL